MLFTSYFGKLNSLPKQITPIAICIKAPVWYKGLQFKKLAPKWSFFNEWKKTKDNPFYIRCYNEQVLSQLDAQDVLNELIDLAHSEHIALLCYERPEQFCHRHLVADWFKENNIPIIEFEFGSDI